MVVYFLVLILNTAEPTFQLLDQGSTRLSDCRARVAEIAKANKLSEEDASRLKCLPVAIDAI